MNSRDPATNHPNELIRSDPGILGGTPVFTGTRVPVKALFDDLLAGHSIPGFLDDFPSVTRHQAVSALRLAAQLLLERARAASTDRASP